MLSCPLCAKTIKSRCNLNRHLTIHINERPYKCSKCPTTCRTSWDLKKHVQVVHNCIKENKCPACSYACSGRYAMAKHARTHREDRPFSCNVPGCGFKTKTEKYSPIHHRRVHELKERLYKCQVVGCDFKAKCLDTLQTHAFTHSNERPFSCTFPECNYTCKRKAELRGHTKRVHDNGGEKPFQCSVCGYQTKHKLYLRQHEECHANPKRFSCQDPNCNFASNNSRNLRLHFDSKHRPKNVSCTATGCNYKCGSIILLKEHLKTHLLPIQKCPRDSCNYSTRLPKNMRRHRKLA